MPNPESHIDRGPPTRSYVTHGHCSPDGVLSEISRRSPNLRKTSPHTSSRSNERQALDRKVTLERICMQHEPDNNACPTRRVATGAITEQPGDIANQSMDVQPTTSRTVLVTPECINLGTRSETPLRVNVPQATRGVPGCLSRLDCPLIDA
jgi:hypothetical protein